MSAHPIVIIAEPDSMISSVLRVEFTHMDCTVLLAADAKEAEEYAWLAAARLIVLDAGRLGLGAFLACARIRRFPGYARRTIVLTAKDMSDRTRAASAKAGATTLLAKPYSVSDLFAAVTPYLAADDPLLITRTRQPAMAEPREWRAAPTPAPRFSDQSALTRNGLLLPIVRGRGVSIPLVRKP